MKYKTCQLAVTLLGEIRVICPWFGGSIEESSDNRLHNSSQTGPAWRQEVNILAQ